MVGGAVAHSSCTFDMEVHYMRHLISVLILCSMLTACSSSTFQPETPMSGISSLSTPNTSIIATPQIPTIPPASPTPTLTPTRTPVPTPKPTVTPFFFAPVKVAEKTEGIDTNDRHNVEMISHVETVGIATDVAVVGDYAYVADEEVGLQVVDISAINKLAGQTTRLPKQSGRKLPGLAMAFKPHYVSSVHNRPYPGKRVWAYRLTVKDNLVYNAAWKAWQIVDVSDPLAPEEIHSQSGPDYVFDIAVTGDYAYIAGNEGVRIMDVSSPTAPVEVNAYIPEDRYVCGLTVEGNYLYATGSSAGLYVVDVSDPLSPIEVSTYTVPLLAWNVKIVGNQAFVVWNLWEALSGPTPECPSGISIIDVSTPETPIEVGNYCCDPGEALDVAVADNYMYVVGSRGLLRVLDISNPMMPVEVGFYDMPGDAWSVIVVGDYIYVADAGGGLFILRFTPD
jgi:hypothetical protein